MKYKLIGISGKKQHGKDTLANFISSEHPAKYTHFKFADKLKDMVCVLLGCTRMELEDPTYKETPLGEEWWMWKSYTLHGAPVLINYKDYPNSAKVSTHINYSLKIKYFDSPTLIKTTPRLILQLLGTECGREIIHPNIWINATMNAVARNHLPGAIITDVRFPNEAEAVKKKGGIVIRIERSSENSSDNHPSEIALDDYENFDYKIYNDGTLEDLRKWVNETI